MKPSLLILLNVILLVNCKNQSKNKDQEDSSIEKLQLQIIEKWPDDIEGCSCYSSKNKTDFQEEKYLYVANYNNLAYLNINGKIEKFKLVNTDTASVKNGLKKTWKNEKFEFTIKTNDVGENGETWQHTGKLILKSDNNRILEQSIYGECGC